MPRAAKYQAFISYRHDASGQLAVALEKALRQYAKPLYKPPIRVFRDEKQIGAGQDLRNTIQQALKDSAYLIYIATREAAESPYVCQELDFWCGALKRQDRLIIIWQKDHLIADPEHDRLDWAASNAIPSNLESQFTGIPVWLDLTWAVDDQNLDLRHPRFKSQINSIVARFRGIPPEDLNGEEIRVHRRNIVIRNVGIGALVAALAMATTAGIIAWQQRNTAVVERDRARSSLLVNASTKVRPWNFTLALGFATEAYSLRLPKPPADIAEALLKAFYEYDSDVAEPYRQLLPHGSGVTVATYSPKGNLLATGSSDGFLRVWSADGVLQKTFQGHRLKVLSAEFSPDAAQIATTGWMDTVVRRWGLDGMPLDPLDYKGAEFAFVEVASTDGAILASFGGEGYRRGFQLWDPVQDSPLLVVPEIQWKRRATLLDVAFSGNGEFIVGLVKDKDRLRLELWDRLGGKPRFPAARAEQGTSSKLLDGPALTDQRFSRPVFGRDVVFRDLSARRWEDLVAGKGSTLERFAVSTNGRLFLQAPRGGTVRLWDERGRLLTKYSVPGDMREAALVGNQGRVVTLSRDDTVSIWDLSGRLLKTFRGHSGRVTAIRVSPDAETLLTASEDTTAKLWPLADELAPECKTELSGVASVRFAPNGGDLLLVVTSDRRVSLRRPGKLPIDSELAEEREVRDALFSPDSRRFVTLGGNRNDLGLWDSEGRLLLRCCTHEAPLTSVAFSPDGRHLLTTSADGAVKVWTAEGAAVASLVEKTDRLVGGQFSPDSSRILTFGSDSGARLWAYRKSLVSTTLSPEHEVTSAQFSPQGDRLILMSTLDGVSLWDREGRHLVSEMEEDRSGIYSACWVAQGDAIVTTHPGGEVKVWSRSGALRHAWRFPAETHYFSADAAPDGSFLVIPGAGIRSLDGISLGTISRHHFLNFLPEGMFLVTTSGGDPSEVAIHDRQGNLVTTLGRLPGTVEKAVVSPEGRLIAILSDSGTLALRCTAAGIHRYIKDAAFYRPGSAERTQYGVDW
jgi:WD40 repeat protein